MTDTADTADAADAADAADTADETPLAPRAPVEVLAIPTMVAVGGLVAVQSQINGALAGRLGDGVRSGAAAAVLAFSGGLVLLAVLVAILPGPRAGVRRLYGAVGAGPGPGSGAGLRPHHLLGGAGGAALVSSQALAVQTIGVALFTVAVVAGQTTSGLVVDRFGLGPSGARAVTPGRVVGAAVTVAAVAVSASGRLSGAGELAGAALALAVLPLLAGCGTSWQQAMNGRVSAASHPLSAAFNNFVVGFVVLVLFLLLSLLAPGDLAAPPASPSSWWLYLGGPLGVVFITAAARLVKVHGVLVLGLCLVAGQVVTSVLLDAMSADAHVGVTTVAGAAVALAGVTIGALAGRGRGGRGRGA